MRLLAYLKQVMFAYQGFPAAIHNHYLLKYSFLDKNQIRAVLLTNWIYMSCGTCSSGGCSTGGCGRNGGCATGGCNKLNTYDWLGNMLSPISLKSIIFTKYVLKIRVKVFTEM
ncbi:MAG: hypothetical protein R3B93_00440 [Bacteroidia bacterium]